VQASAGNPNTGNTSAGNPNAGGQPSNSIFPGAPADSFMERQMAESRRRLEEQQQRMEQQRADAEARRQALFAQQQQQQQEEEARRQQREQERLAREQEQQRRHEEMLASNSIPQQDYDPGTPPSSFSGGPGPMYEEIYECSNCKKEVPAHYGAGSECPHCGITFDYVEDSSGNREYRDGYTAYGGIGFIVLTVIGIAIRVMVAMARD
jgi:predicted RNA-binding Zn-ribbon protein involved in translation (DUF1610 family)